MAGLKLTKAYTPAMMMMMMVNTLTMMIATSDFDQSKGNANS